MCEAVVPDGDPVDVNGTNPLNVTLTSIVRAVVSSITVAFPVPEEPVGGDSRPWLRAPDKVKMSA
jgi:hypothetical protein